MRGVLHPEVRAFLRCAKGMASHHLGSSSRYRGSNGCRTGAALAVQCSAAHNLTLQCLCSTAQDSTSQCLCRAARNLTTHCLCMTLLCHCDALPRLVLLCLCIASHGLAAATLHACRSGRSPSRRTDACGIHAQGDSGNSAPPRPSWGPWSPSVRLDPWRPRLSGWVSFYEPFWSLFHKSTIFDTQSLSSAVLV